MFKKQIWFLRLLGEGMHVGLIPISDPGRASTMIYPGTLWPLCHGNPSSLHASAFCQNRNPSPPFVLPKGTSSLPCPPLLPLAWLAWPDLPVLCGGRQLCNGWEVEGVHIHSSTHSSWLWEETRSLQAFTEKSSLCRFSGNKDCVSHHRGLFSGHPSQRTFVRSPQKCWQCVSFSSLL